MTASALADLLRHDQGWHSLVAARQFMRGPIGLAERLTLVGLLKSDALAGRSDFENRSVRLAIASDASLDNLSDPLLLRLLERGLFGRLYIAPFGQVGQEVRDAGSWTIKHRAEVVVLAPLTAFWSRDVATVPGAIRQVAEETWSHVTALRERYDGLILLVNLRAPESRPYGILDPRSTLGRADFVRSVNLLLAQRCLESNMAYILDAESLSTRCGMRWPEINKQHFMAGRPFADELAAELAADISAFCAALKGGSRKCLVVDLDNTLWGGVVGEDGFVSLNVGGAFPGNLYTALQREICSLRARGVILTIISKNNEADAWEVFERRSEMVLKRGDFTMHRINWRDKATNLREIAAELNLGADAFVMLDDSPLERAWIEASLPEVMVCPASDPLEMLRWLTTCRLFDTLAISREDALRANSYAAAEKRSRMASAAGSLADYLETLGTVLEVGLATSSHLARVSQLTQKTNQFNLTTRRYTELQLQNHLRDSAWRLFYCGCRDRFADEGIIGVAFVHIQGLEWHLDSFMISCRILGRGVEKGFLHAICAHALAEGAHSLRGEYLRTEKNGQTENFFELCGFVVEDRTPDHGIWRLPLSAAPSLKPSWIAINAIGSDNYE